MRDDVELSANVFVPASGGRVPAILLRTPYGKGASLPDSLRVFVQHGYAVVVQDVRGRYASEGVFDPLHQEVADGEDTLSWIASQEWSNQRVGMVGGSYLGITQWKAALSGSPYLKAIFPVVAGGDEYLDRFYSPGGALKLGHRLEWLAENLRASGFRPAFERFVRSVPLRTADLAATGRAVDFFQRALDHPAYDAYWKSMSTREQIGRIHVPVFAAGGWYDNFVQSDLEAFRLLRGRRRAVRLIVGPWPHNFSYSFPGVDFGPGSRLGLRQMQLEWFDYWLKRDGAAHLPNTPPGPPLRIFIMGANRWRDEQAWPPERARPVMFYLSGRGRAKSTRGDGRLVTKPPRHNAFDAFIYDPHDPVPTAGGAVCCNPKLLPWGPMDQRAIERRKDVLIYTSAPLKRPLEVTGPVRAVLYVSTSARDTDFTAKLVDVYPDGRALNITDGILRLRYRESLERSVPAVPGAVYALSIDAGVTSIEFAKGHRIRLEVSSSNFPRFDRNPNTGRPVADERELLRASQAVYHSRQRPSHLLLSVVP
ncbi:MAG TPA: CocE/NonD family hydrolase [Bryobacteraceae bacterium]